MKIHILASSTEPIAAQVETAVGSDARYKRFSELLAPFPQNPIKKNAPRIKARNKALDGTSLDPLMEGDRKKQPVAAQVVHTSSQACIINKHDQQAASAEITPSEHLASLDSIYMPLFSYYGDVWPGQDEWHLIVLSAACIITSRQIRDHILSGTHTCTLARRCLCEHSRWRDINLAQRVKSASGEYYRERYRLIVHAPLLHDRCSFVGDVRAAGSAFGCWFYLHKSSLVANIDIVIIADQADGARVTKFADFHRAPLCS